MIVNTDKIKYIIFSLKELDFIENITYHKELCKPISPCSYSAVKKADTIK